MVVVLVFVVFMFVVLSFFVVYLWILFFVSIMFLICEFLNFLNLIGGCFVCSFVVVLVLDWWFVDNVFEVFFGGWCFYVG